MLQSQLFPKTKKEPPKDAVSVNHKLLVRGGFMDQLMAGSWTLLPLGYRVVTKINSVIREEMNAIGGQELLMPLLHPKSIWNETGRWDKADEIMYKLKDPRGKEHVLSFTHEEIVMDLLRKHTTSYQDFPKAIYHFSTKFRNELRSKSGILRGREFMMKDLYSVHTSEDDLMEYYEKVKSAYKKIFERLGFYVLVAEASGGVFTDKNTHEFQVPTKVGEDIVYFCKSCGWAQNKEVFTKKLGDNCPACKNSKIDQTNAIEVGNIFPLGTWYSQAMRFYYTDEDGKKQLVWFGSYGIGCTRLMGTWVEISHDQNGIIWNKNLSPFDVHLIELKSEQTSKKAESLYNQLRANNIDVLWDDRSVGAGQKFADCDLIGNYTRLVVSEKTKDKIEYKLRSSKDSELLSLDELINKLNSEK